MHKKVATFLLKNDENRSKSSTVWFITLTPEPGADLVQDERRRRGQGHLAAEPPPAEPGELGAPGTAPALHSVAGGIQVTILCSFVQAEKFFWDKFFS
jgi:hypothetical protein